MSDTGGPNEKGKGNNLSKEVVPFLKSNSYWATGAMASFLNYKAMSRIFWGGMAGRGPAVVFVGIFGLINYGIFKQTTKIIKNNAKEAIKRSKSFEE